MDSLVASLDAANGYDPVFQDRRRLVNRLSLALRAHKGELTIINNQIDQFLPMLQIVHSISEEEKGRRMLLYSDLQSMSNNFASQLKSTALDVNQAEFRSDHRFHEKLVSLANTYHTTSQRILALNVRALELKGDMEIVMEVDDEQEMLGGVTVEPAKLVQKPVFEGVVIPSFDKSLWYQGHNARTLSINALKNTEIAEEIIGQSPGVEVPIQVDMDVVDVVEESPGIEVEDDMDVEEEEEEDVNVRWCATEHHVNHVNHIIPLQPMWMPELHTFEGLIFPPGMTESLWYEEDFDADSNRVYKEFTRCDEVNSEGISFFLCYAV